ncbi:Hypothetical predicted protein [Podarcis lilfordi]|uniref:Uncharacterized protein n=1 Tax=Podarcis lilfordi TaxID=74358 RepID=A0AA35LN92_9SAUR|nr:Hypothetical predicted protein [Podarcis lilfordi]
MEKEISELHKRNAELEACASDLQSGLEEARAAQSGATGGLLGRSKASWVEKFNGDPEGYLDFKTEMRYFMELESAQFDNDAQKVAHIISHLSGGGLRVGANTSISKGVNEMEMFTSMEMEGGSGRAHED